MFVLFVLFVLWYDRFYTINDQTLLLLFSFTLFTKSVLYIYVIDHKIISIFLFMWVHVFVYTIITI